MPRSFSSAIQSEVACLVALRDLTEPAIWIAPPNSSSFSVSVVLAASGCEMIAKVRRRAVSVRCSDMEWGKGTTRGARIVACACAASGRSADKCVACAQRTLRTRYAHALDRERERLQRHARVDLHREVQVRAGGEAGVAGRRDTLARAHALAD